MIALFAGHGILLQGVLAGLIFGFLLQKGRVARFDVIVGQLLLRDFTIIKIMLSAIVVGSIGVYAMLDTGLIAGLSIKSVSLEHVMIGGGLFGIGMACLGYCPGTALAAAGAGAKDAWWGILGMLVGSAFFAEAYPLIEQFIPRGDARRTTLATAMGLPHWVIITFLILFFFAMLVLFAGYEQKREE